jgi:hypothetical protein
MQFHVRLGAARNGARKSIQQDRGDAVQRNLVHLVEGEVHEACDHSLDPHPAHQFAHGRIIAKRHQRAEIPVAPWLDFPLGQKPLQLPRQMRSLLVRSLRTRRHGFARMTDPGTGGAVTNGKDVRISRGLQRRQHHEAVADLFEDWKEHGIQVIREVRESRPADYAG